MKSEELTLNEWKRKGKELFGEDMDDWKVKCNNCGRIQSANVIRKQVEAGIPSKRHGVLKKGKGESMRPFEECYSPDCNWVAYGLFNSGFKVSKSYLFPFAEGEVK